MTQTTGETWKALREASGLTQREAERQMGWAANDKGHGRLSLIERGISPTPDQEAALRKLYATRLLGEVTA